MRNINDILNLIQYHPLYNIKHHIVGFENQNMELEELEVFKFCQYKRLQDEWFVPLHRIVYIKQNGRVAWDKRLGFDNI